MDKSIKKEFIEKLLDYEKGKEYLREFNNEKYYYTLMGVFCDIFINKLKANWIQTPFIKNITTFYLLGELKVVSKILLKKLKITSDEYTVIIECQKKYKDKPDFKNEIIYLTKNL